MAPAAEFISYLPETSAEVVTFDGTTLSGTSIPIEAYVYSYSSNPVDATLTFSATAAGPAGDIAGFFFDQPVNNISFNITADTPVNGTSNILSGTASAGQFAGTDAGFSLSAQNQTFNDGIVFTSGLTDAAQFSDLSFQINTGPPDPDASDSCGTLCAFDAVATPGSFVGTAPEPASIGLLAIGCALLGIAATRRKPFAAVKPANRLVSRQ